MYKRIFLFILYPIYTLSLNVVVIGSDISSKLATIVLSNRGHMVNLVQPSSKDELTSNLILTEKDMEILNRYDVNYIQKSVNSDSLVQHNKGQIPILTNFEQTCSIQKGDLLNIMNKKIENNNNIMVTRGEFNGADFSRKIAFLSHGPLRYDILIGADGFDSKVSSCLKDFYPNFSVSEFFQGLKSYKELTLSPIEFQNIPRYHEKWTKSLHVWESNDCKVVASPTSSLGLSGHVFSSDIQCKLDEFPDICDSMTKENMSIYNNNISVRNKRYLSSHFGYLSVLLLGEAGNSLTYENLRISLEDCVNLDYCLSCDINTLHMCKMYNNIKSKQYVGPRFKLPIL